MQDRSGFDYLNYKIINFELVDKAVVPLKFQTKYDGNYPVELIFEAYGGGYGKNMLCHESTFTSIHKITTQYILNHKLIL